MRTEREPVRQGISTMSMMRPIAWLIALTVVFATAPGVQAQGVRTSPGGDAFWKFQPFLDPGYFNPDFQFFAPAEVDDFGGEEKPNTGLYVTFDRTFVNVTRPIDRFSFGSGNQGDFTWGNRLEVGYMHGDPSGWQAVLWHVMGPNENFANTEYLQQYQDPAGDTLQVLTPGGVDSINIFRLSSFELNRVYRVKPLHNNTTVEPLIGYRYMNARDVFRRDTFTEVAVIFPPPREFLQNNTEIANFENQMHGGQLGARIFRQRGHWLLSADVRFFGMANFQTLRRVDQFKFVPNPDYALVQGLLLDVIQSGLGGDVNRTVQYHRATQFVFGGEVRGEASYELTRDINLRVGFVFLDLGQGIGRGDRPGLNNQAVQIAGATFGFTVNR
jgi:hypothetical protein